MFLSFCLLSNCFGARYFLTNLVIDARFFFVVYDEEKRGTFFNTATSQYAERGRVSCLYAGC